MTLREKGQTKTTQRSQAHDLWTWRFLLVRLVAVPHFDSPFDKTDHVFILNTERKRFFFLTWSKRGNALQGDSAEVLADLKEGERRPLEETLSIADLSV